MAERIIPSLDSNGYLKTPLEELLPPVAADVNGDLHAYRAKQLPIAEEALRIVQRLDPPGVGARTLKECLLLQLIPGMPDYDELRLLIENHLEDLENNRLPQISKKTGMTIEKIQEVWHELRKLKPKPGADFSETTAPSVTPDVFVERNDEGKLIALDVKVGDRILFGKYSGSDIKIDGDEFLIMREDEVLGVLEGAGKKAKA